MAEKNEFDKSVLNGCYVKDGLLCLQDKLEYDSDDRCKYTNGYVVLPIADSETNDTVRKKTKYMKEIMRELEISLHYRIGENYSRDEIAENRKYPELFFYVSCSNSCPSGDDAVRFYQSYKDAFFAKYIWTMVDDNIPF